MLELDHLTVSGDVTFGKDVSLKVNIYIALKKFKHTKSVKTLQNQ